MGEMPKKVNRTLMNETLYREHPGVNFSTLKLMQKSPLHYKWALENPGEDTPALKAGRAIHMAVLQPKEFDEMYAVAPEGIDRRTKAGKEAWATFEESVNGREVITTEEFDEYMRMAECVRWSCDILKDTRNEIPLYWEDERTGMKCKCRVDAMKETKERFIMIDLKTTTDADLKSFTRSALSYGYHMQAAHYINGAMANKLNQGKPVEWYFVAVEKKPPYAVNIIKAMPDFIEEGRMALNDLMDELDTCQRMNQWPGYGACEMYLPKWMKKDEEDK